VCYKGDVELKYDRSKEYECIEVKNHKDVGKTIEEWQMKGWRLHTYTCTQYSIDGDVHHHLLFEIGGQVRQANSQLSPFFV
jgi:hypothetical protein